MNEDTQKAFIIGQKYAYATVALVLGIACFTSILGLEKAILAIIFGWLALRDGPGPRLADHRGRAKAGLILAAIVLVTVPTVLLLNLDRIRTIIDAISSVTEGK